MSEHLRYAIPWTNTEGLNDLEVVIPECVFTEIGIRLCRLAERRVAWEPALRDKVVWVREVVVGSVSGDLWKANECLG